jgi:hypothetical protein
MVIAATVTASATMTVAGTGKPASSGGTDGVAAVDCLDYDALPVAGVLTSTQTWKDNSADADGVATWYRDVYSTLIAGVATTDDGTSRTDLIRKQGTVTSVGGGGDCTLTNTTITATTPVQGTSGTFTVPK